jgi:D-glycero-alpha-D-manno-heptose-7-phosphate kinase
MQSLVISRTPLRVSFFGGGTDLPEYYLRYGGRVLSCTIDKYVYVAVKSRWDGHVVVNAAGPAERVRDPGEVRNGIVREALRLTGIRGGVEVTSMSDVPAEGSGLGSSSAFAVGLLAALSAYQGRHRTAGGLAELACHLEIDLLRAPIGKQDQYAVAHGGYREYRFHPDGSVNADPVELDATAEQALARHALMFFTGRTRKAAGVLADQRARLDQTVSHLHAIRDIVPAGRSRLLAADVPRLGALLHASWERKRQLSERICDGELDTVYRRAVQAGAYGGKLLGAGGGGFFLFLCPPSRHHAVRAALAGYQEMPFSFERSGTRIVLEAGQPAATAA